MTSLFMPFDLHYFYLSLSFVLISFFLLLNSFFKISLLSSSMGITLNFLLNFFLSLKPKMFNKFSSLMFISIFSLVLISNLWSVFSFNFPVTSQVSMVMVLSLSIWFSLMLFSLINNLKFLASHFIPEGTPLPLTVLLFLIELVSNMIRPLTLMVRLVANILAGHLLMSLLSQLVFSFSTALLFYLGLNLAEVMVSIIQAYIFSTMIVLYYADV